LRTIPETRADLGAGPTEAPQRITALDVIRGFAVLGIITMNSVHFGLFHAYNNLSASSPQSPLDWFIGALGEVFFDQKFMALFSMLFGAGVVLFAERAAARGGRPFLLTLWRNFLLLLIGIVHMMVWDGDVLVTYAICAVPVFLVRKLPPVLLLVAGGLTTMVPPIIAGFAQETIPASGVGLGIYWNIPGEASNPVLLWEAANGWARAFGAMLIGVALYRSGFLTGARSVRLYRRAATWGLGIGIPVSFLGLMYVAVNDFAPSTALVGTIPNAIATIPIALAYAALILMWHSAHVDHPFDRRIRDVGRMALTNYLTQTALGVLFLQVIFGDTAFSRTELVVCVLIIWALQLWWSKAWLSRFRFGPAEWLWRAATYRRLP
jgi:uncharacterized protein